MIADYDPSVLRRKLATALRKARENAHFSQREAAEALDWSLSKLIRIEKGAQGLSVTDLKALFDLYQVADEQLITDLSAAARGSRGQSWWNGYRDIVSPHFAQYLGHESIASSLQHFHPLVVPGLLQTEAYAAAVLGAHPEPERTRRVVELRMERQERLFARRDLTCTFIVNEEVLHRWIGGPRVMRQQLQRLRDVAGQPNMSLQVVPFCAGAHPGMRGSFILLSLGETAEDLLFLESVSGDYLTRDDPEQIAKYAAHFETLRELALPDEQKNSLLSELIDRIATRDDVPRTALWPEVHTCR
jgi:transcriptional regulator with XRE-family HTH domain